MILARFGNSQFRKISQIGFSFLFGVFHKVFAIGSLLMTHMVNTLVVHLETKSEYYTLSFQVDT